MVPWSVLVERQPELARRGARRLFEFGGGLAFLSTPRAEGEPRVQPAHPVLIDGSLYVARTPTPVRRRTVEPREAYALQAFPLAGKGAGEFYLTGEAVLLGRPPARSELAWQIRRSGRPDNVICELLITWALYSGWETTADSGLRPVRLQWHAEFSRQPSV